MSSFSIIKATRHFWLLASLFFLSGFASLSYQVVWQRVLTQSIGSDAHSAGIVVTSFMIFLGIGSEIARRLLKRKVTSTSKLYAYIEIGVGLYGAVSVLILRAVNQFTSSIGSDSLLIDSVVNMATLALPIIGMGMTTPLMIHIVKGRIENLGKISGFFYAANIMGAAVGALTTGLVSIEVIGLSGTSWIAAVFNASIGLIIWKFGIANSNEDAHQSTAIDGLKNRGSTYLIAVIFGFSTLAVQAVFFRILSNYFTLSTIVFPIVLAVYLTLMSLGQLIGGFYADRFAKRLVSLVAAFVVCGAALVALVLNFPPRFAAYVGAVSFTSFNGSVLPVEWHGLIGDPSPITVLLFSGIFMLAVVPLAGLFPALLRILTTKIEDAGEEFARLYSAYTVGNVAGTILTVFFILPQFGTPGAATATVASVGIGCVLLGLYSKSKVAIASGLAALALSVMVPADYYKGFSLGDYKITQVIEGRNGVATVVPTDRFYTIIDMNRTASASAIVRDPVPGDLYESWRWNHSELLAFDKTFRPRNALIIGIGHAFLIQALLDLPFLEKITVVDISEEVVQAVKENTKGSLQSIFSDPRVEIVIADGRRFVQKSITQGKKYDLIQNKINEPWHAGSGNLFTTEFFELEKQLLSNGGYLGVRPLVGHLTDGYRVFGNALFSPGHYHLFFKKGKLPTPNQIEITDDIRLAWNAQLPARKSRTSRENKISYAVFNETPEWEIDENTDDRPTFEYYWTRKTLSMWNSPRVGVSDLEISKFTKILTVTNP